MEEFNASVRRLTGDPSLSDAILCEAKKTATVTAFSVPWLLNHALDDLESGRTVEQTVGYIYALRLGNG